MTIGKIRSLVESAADKLGYDLTKVGIAGYQLSEVVKHSYPMRVRLLWFDCIGDVVKFLKMKRDS